MRVSSGVRNLIAGGGGGGGGGDAGAGSAPGASPPPVPAGTGAAEVPATATLAAGRRAAQAPASALDTADALTGARQVPLEELVHPVDARAGERDGRGRHRDARRGPSRAHPLQRHRRAAQGAGARRCASTRQRRRVRRRVRRRAAFGHPSSTALARCTARVARSERSKSSLPQPSTARNARMVRPHPSNPRGERPELELGLPGGANDPPQSAALECDLLVVCRRLHELRSHYATISRTDTVDDFTSTIDRISRLNVNRFHDFGGILVELEAYPTSIQKAEQAYLALQKMARQAEREGQSRSGRCDPSVLECHRPARRQ